MTALTKRAAVRHLLRRASRDERGAYLIELALIMPVFLLIVMGTFDLGFQAYARATLSGAVEYASRNNTLEINNANQATVDQDVRNRVGTVARFATLSFTRTNFNNFSDVNKPEDFNDTNGNGIRDPFECFSDANNNNTFDSNRGASGQGGASDVVVYEATMSYNRLFPLWRMLGQPQQQQIKVRTLLRNQPFSNQTDSTVVVCPQAP